MKWRNEWVQGALLPAGVRGSAPHPSLTKGMTYMSSNIGRAFRVQIFGESHGPMIGVTIDGLPAGIQMDEAWLNGFVQRRAAKGSAIATPRRESDIPRIISGVNENGRTTGYPLTAVFENSNTHSSDYSFLPDKPRPGHADYPAITRSLGEDDLRGSGHHSGRLTLPQVFAGGVAMLFLRQIGVDIAAHILQVGSVRDASIDPVNPDMEALHDCHLQEVPALDPEAGQRMMQTILDAKADMDSVGGIVEVVATGVPAGIGAPYFDGVEAAVAQQLFSIPAVKGVEFGAGFDCAMMPGSRYNDPYCMEDGEIRTTRNAAGGLLGGITNGMPIIARCAFRPTASIGKEQQTVSLSAAAIGKDAETTLVVKGRHDPCVAIRAVPVVEAAVAIALADLYLQG